MTLIKLEMVPPLSPLVFPRGHTVHHQNPSFSSHSHPSCGHVAVPETFVVTHSWCQIFNRDSTHRVSAHHFRVVDHAYEVDDGKGRIENIGAEEVFVEGDPLAAQTPV